MSKEGVVESRGIVEECLPGAIFKVKIFEIRAGEDYVTIPEEEARYAQCTISGRVRKNRVRILPGDIVQIESSLYDLEKGRIVFREK